MPGLTASSGISAYELEEKLLSNRTRLSRNVFFALGTSREQANAPLRQGVTNTSELGFVDPAPKHTPRNIYLGRTLGRETRSAPSVRTQSAVHDDELQVQRLQMELAEEAEKDEPEEEKPEEVQKRHESTLGQPGVSFSRMPRFGSATSTRSGSGGRGKSSVIDSGQTTARSRPRSAQEMVREAEKENAIAEQRAMALHPTRYVKLEVKERREQVEQQSARPTFGLPPPPLPAVCNASGGKLSSSRPGSGKASDIQFPWEKTFTKKERVGPVDTAALEADKSRRHWLVSDEEEAMKAEQEWQEARERYLDNCGLLLGARTAESVKKRQAKSGTTVMVDIAHQVSRDKVATYHARTNEHHDLFYTTSDEKTGRVRHQPKVNLSKYAKRFQDARPFHYVPDELLKTDHLLKTHKGMVDRERNNFVRLLTDATEEEIKILGNKPADPIKLARCEAAKAFLRQFNPPDSVDIPGLPISAADDARFNDGFTTTTRARPKTSNESVVTRRFKGAPHLANMADRPADHFANQFGGQYHAMRRAAEKEVDAQLERAHTAAMFKHS